MLAKELQGRIQGGVLQTGGEQRPPRVTERVKMQIINPILFQSGGGGGGGAGNVGVKSCLNGAQTQTGPLSRSVSPGNVRNLAAPIVRFGAAVFFLPR